MFTMFNTPKYKHVIYTFNPTTGHYQKSRQQPEAIPVNILPFELRRELTQAEKIKDNAAEILTTRARKKENGSRKLLTGLQPLTTIAQGWYYGNVLGRRDGKKILSDLLIHFLDNGSRMQLFLFAGYHKHTAAQREQFAARMIPHLVKHQWQE